MNSKTNKHLTIEAYIARYGYICGVSYKPGAGSRATYGYLFRDISAAKQWLRTEQYDFRERELLGKGEARRRYGLALDDGNLFRLERYPE